MGSLSSLSDNKLFNFVDPSYADATAFGMTGGSGGVLPRSPVAAASSQSPSRTTTFDIDASCDAIFIFDTSMDSPTTAFGMTGSSGGVLPRSPAAVTVTPAVTPVPASAPKVANAPISFNDIDDIDDNFHVVIWNGRKKTEKGAGGFKEYTKRVEDPTICSGYEASKDKGKFVIDNVINPLLKEKRKFYIKEVKEDPCKLLDLTDPKEMEGFAKKVSQKMRDRRNGLRKKERAFNGHRQALNTTDNDQHNKPVVVPRTQAKDNAKGKKRKIDSLDPRL